MFVFWTHWFSKRDPNKMSSDGEGFMEAYSSVGRSHGFTEETLNLSMTARQPPSYDGKVSWSEGLDERVLTQTSQLLPSQKAEHQVPHIHIKICNSLDEMAQDKMLMQEEWPRLQICCL